jgi:hypothetical protein
MLLGGKEVSSVSHVIVFAGSGNEADFLASGLREKFGRAPLCAPEAAWVRSCYMHADSAERTGRPRTPIWIVPRKEVENCNKEVASLLQLPVLELAYNDVFYIRAKKYSYFVTIPGVGRVELIDVALVVCGNCVAAIKKLLQVSFVVCVLWFVFAHWKRVFV